MKRGFNNDECNSGAVAQAIRNLMDGTSTNETFLIAQHPNHGNEVYEKVTVAWGEIDGKRVLRYCSPSGDPMMAGSSSVIGSGRGYDALDLVAVLASYLAKATLNYPKHLGDAYPTPTYPMIFRQ